MLWVYGHFLLFQRGDRLQTSESDVYRLQILTSKVNPNAEMVKLVAVNEVDIIIGFYWCIYV